MCYFGVVFFISIFSENLRYFRLKSGLSQEQLAGLLGLSKSSINMYERGDREPSLKTIDTLVVLFNITYDLLLGRRISFVPVNGESHLGTIIKQYRDAHAMSMDDFAKVSGLSKGYISMLEKNRHPRSGKPLSPTLETYKACASAMGMTLNDLLAAVDDRVDLFAVSDFPISPKVLDIAMRIEQLPEPVRERFLAAIDTLLTSQE